MLAVEDEGIAGAELGPCKGVGVMTASPPGNLPTPEVSGDGHGIPKSLSYTMLSVVGKKGVCPHATP